MKQGSTAKQIDSITCGKSPEIVKQQLEKLIVKNKGNNSDLAQYFKTSAEKELMPLYEKYHKPQYFTKEQIDSAMNFLIENQMVYFNYGLDDKEVVDKLIETQRV
ncbi:MAG: hypothetical protein HC831_09930 [Chloroflexia bacterium]|nr:hypothetical protein [Chloroflexia bacterium]